MHHDFSLPLFLWHMQSPVATDSIVQQDKDASNCRQKHDGMAIKQEFTVDPACNKALMTASYLVSHLPAIMTFDYNHKICLNLCMFAVSFDTLKSTKALMSAPSLFRVLSTLAQA